MRFKLLLGVFITLILILISTETILARSCTNWGGSLFPSNGGRNWRAELHGDPWGSPPDSGTNMEWEINWCLNPSGGGCLHTSPDRKTVRYQNIGWVNPPPLGSWVTKYLNINIRDQIPSEYLPTSGWCGRIQVDVKDNSCSYLTGTVTGMVYSSGSVCPVDSPPTCSIWPDNGNIETGHSTNIKGDASDPDGDSIEWRSWSVTGGSLNSSWGDPPKTYTAPSTAGTYAITASVRAKGVDRSCLTAVTVTKPDNPPTCNIWVDNSNLETGQSETVYGNKSDPDGDAVEWRSWSVTGGSLNSTFSNPPKTYTAPSTAGTYTITANVRANGLDGSCSTTVTVTQPDRPPTCTITPDSSTRYPGENTWIPGSASDPDGDSVEWRGWSATGGTLNSTWGNPPKNWVAPSGTGAYTITANIRANGVDTSCSAQITVEDRPPTCTLSANPGTIYVNGTSTISGNASDPDGHAITWGTWSILGGGSLNSYTGAPPKTYTAPGGTGTKTVRTSVTANGLTAQCSVDVVVIQDNPPTCTLSADPTTIYVNGTSTISGSASDPDGHAITWGTWSILGGGSLNSYSGSPPKTYTAPGNPGTKTVRTSVTANGLTAQCSVNIEVLQDNPPTCTITPDSSTRYPGENTWIPGSASDPDGDSIEWRGWSATGGTLNSTWGNPPKNWVAPSGIGSYTITANIRANGVDANCTAVITVEQPDRPPTCSIWPADGTIYINESTTISGTASDPDGDTVDWQNWSITGGYLDSTWGPPPKTYTAPSTEGTYTITANVRANNVSNSCSTNVIVVKPDTPPTCSIWPDDSTLETGQSTNIQGSASDPDGDTVEWRDWSVTGGSLSSYWGTPPKTYTAPGTPGSYSIVANVRANGLNVNCSTTIVVVGPDNPPTCNIWADDSSLETGQSTAIRGNASDPDGDTVSWTTWSVTGGLLNSYWGSPPKTYTAPSAAGAYTVTANVTANGLSASCSTTITVTIPDRPPTCSIWAADGTIYTGESTTISGTASDPDGDSVEWRGWGTTGGSLNSTWGPPPKTYTAPSSAGTYTINANIRANGVDASCSTNVDVVQPDRPPTCSIWPDEANLETAEYTVVRGTASDPDGDSVQWRWWGVTGGSLSSYQGNPPKTYRAPSTPGTYTITANIRANGVDRDCSTTVTVTQADRPPTCSIWPDDSSIEVDQSTNIQGSASDPDGDAIEWRSWAVTGGSLNSSWGDPPKTYTAPTTAGSYSIVVNVRANGRNANCSTTVVVVGEDNPPTCTLTAENSDILTGQSTTINGSASDPDEDVVSWTTWGVTGGSLSSYWGDPPKTYTAPSSAGTYTVTANVSANGLSGSCSTTINVEEPDTPPTCSIWSADGTIYTNESTTISGFASDAEGDPISWPTWSVTGGTLDSNTGPPPKIYTAPATGGNYSVTATVTAGGLQGQCSTAIIVVEPPRGDIQLRIFNDVNGNGQMDEGEAFITESTGSILMDPSETQEDPPQDGCPAAIGSRFKDILYDVPHTVSFNITLSDWEVTGAYYTNGGTDCDRSVSASAGAPISETEYQVNNVSVWDESTVTNLWFGAKYAPQAPTCTVINANPSVLVVGETTQLEAVVSGTGTLTYSWTVTPAVGSFTPVDPTVYNPTYTAPVTVPAGGQVTVGASVTDENGLTGNCPSVDIEVKERVVQGRFFMDDGGTDGMGAGDGYKDMDEEFIDPPTGTLLQLLKGGTLRETISQGVPVDSCGPKTGFRSSNNLPAGTDYELVADIQGADSGWEFTGVYYTLSQAGGVCKKYPQCGEHDPLCGNPGYITHGNRRYQITGINIVGTVLNIWFGLKVVPTMGDIQGRIFNDDGGGDPLNAGNGIKDPGEGFVTASIGTVSISPVEVQDAPPQDGCDVLAQGFRYKEALYVVAHTVTLDIGGSGWRVTGAYYTDDQSGLSCVNTGGGKVGTVVSSTEYQVDNVQTSETSSIVNLWFGVSQNSTPVCTWDPTGGVPPDTDGDGNPNLPPGDTWPFKVIGYDADDSEVLTFDWEAKDAGGSDCGTLGVANLPNVLAVASGTTYSNTRDWTMPDPADTCTVSARVTDTIGASDTCSVTVGPGSKPWMQVKNGDVYSNCNNDGALGCDDTVYGISMFVHDTPVSAEPFFLASDPASNRGGSLIARLGMDCRSCQAGATLNERVWEVVNYSEELEWPRDIINSIIADDFSGVIKIDYDDGSGGDFWITPANAVPGDPTVYVAESNVRIREDVTQIEAIVISKRMIIIEDLGANNTLRVLGALYAKSGFDFEQREAADNRDPVIEVEYDPRYVMIGHVKFYEPRYSWGEE